MTKKQFAVALVVLFGGGVVGGVLSGRLDGAAFAADGDTSGSQPRRSIRRPAGVGTQMKPLSIIQGTVATLANWPREKNSTGTEAWVSRPGNHPAGNPVDVDERLVTTDPHMQALLATALTSGGRVLVKARSVDVDGQHAYFDPESIVIWHPSVAEE